MRKKDYLKLSMKERAALSAKDEGDLLAQELADNLNRNVLKEEENWFTDGNKLGKGLSVVIMVPNSMPRSALRGGKTSRAKRTVK